MKISKLLIEDFRHIKDQEIEFGNRLTVITGQNGTGKSSLLGWIAQSCNFSSNYSTVLGEKFKTQYSEVFTFCKEKDYKKEYSVSLLYSEDINKEKTKMMKTRYLPKTKKSKERYKVDYDGRGKAIDFPIIYLGLKRLIPLATEKNISLKEINLSKDNINTFSKLSKEILILPNNSILTEHIQSTNKNILAMKTEKYGHLGNSAGQDNIGQIISSIISFENLKQTLKEKYKGGIILIDEIDATLYAGSQIQLVKKLFIFANKLDLQIIFTTHSLEILEYFSSNINENIKVNFLEERDGRIVNKINPAINILRNKIKVQVGEKNKIKKIEVICEDDVAAFWVKNLTKNSKFKDYLNILKGPFANGNLVNMAESKHPLFKDVCFVLDGDCSINFTNKKKPPRTVFLPGAKPPEVLIYNFIKEISDSDSFWQEDEEFNFSKQVCFQDYSNNNLGTCKKWFKDENFKKFFGRGYSKIFNKWKKENKEEADLFIESIEKVISEDIRL